ncbi:MAG: hypothetical protein QMD92_00155 [bacterium]|nr:hypothetical protein [bacterium]
MTYERLRWIVKAVEWRRLRKGETSFILGALSDCINGREINKSTEKELEALFRKVQWRDNKESTIPVVEEIEELELDEVSA